MANLLSQEEIDALLTDVTGEEGSHPFSEKEKRKYGCMILNNPT